MTDSTPSRSRRTLYIIAGAVGALLVVIIVLLVVIVQQNNAATFRDDSDRINKICEQQFADPYGEDLQAMLDCTNRLLEDR